MTGLADQALSQFLGLPRSLSRHFSEALTSGRDVGFGCKSKLCAAAIAARRVRAVVIILPSVSIK